MKRASGNACVARRTYQACDLHVLCTLLQVTEEYSICTSLPTQHHYYTAKEKRSLSSLRMDEALVDEEGTRKGRENEIEKPKLGWLCLVDMCGMWSCLSRSQSIEFSRGAKTETDVYSMFKPTYLTCAAAVALLDVENHSHDWKRRTKKNGQNEERPEEWISE